MKKSIILLSFFIFAHLSGCVSKSKYENAALNLEKSAVERSIIKQDNDKLAAEVKNFEYRNAYLQSAK